MKNILITGATSGIGKVTAEILSKENKVFLTGRRKLNLENYFSCDLTDINQINLLFEEAKNYFNGGIDVLINCAGQYIYKSIEDMTLADINYLTNLDFIAPYMLSKLVIPDMKQNKWGRIVNIGSISGIVGEASATMYSACKAGLSGLVKSLALEVAQYDITVNQINPGWVDTPLVNVLSEDEKREVIDVTPQKRFVEPIEIAKLVEYLISDSAKGITGQNINVCAGLTIGC